MELKTLKDFIYRTESSKQPNVNSDELKREAIKDIKEIRKIPENDFIISDYGRLDRHSIASWIKYYFNITEEELK